MISESDWQNLANEIFRRLLERSESKSEMEPEQGLEVNLPGRSKREQREIAAKAEDFVDETDYWNRETLSPGASFALREHLPSRPLFRERIETEVDSLYTREDQQMLLDSSYARRRIKEVIDRIEALLYASFDLEMVAHRPVDSETERLHRYWSKQRYQGVAYSRIMAEAKAQGHSGITKDHIKLAVKRSRERREPIQRRIRHLIYRKRLQE